MGKFLLNLDTLRHIDWARAWHWDIKIPEAPYPFKDWFPASAVEENLATIEPYNFTAGFSSYDVPKQSQAFTLNVTFFDNDKLALFDWFTVWMNEVIIVAGKNGATYVAALDSCVKEVIIAKLATGNKLISLNSYWVFPTGNLNYPGSSDNSALSTSVEFKVAALKRNNFT